MIFHRSSRFQISLVPTARRRSLRGWLGAAATGLMLSCSLPAHALSKNNHEVVGDVAVLYLQQMPQGQRTLQQVSALLGADTPGAAARWADDIKDIDEAALPKLAPTDIRAVFLGKVQAYYSAHPEMAVGEAANRPLMGHKLWHYTDVPFQLPAYKLGETGTRPDDVVQMLGHCIRVLRDGSSPGAPIALTKPEALRLLLHYVGDIHQPLHVGSAYLAQRGGTWQFVVPSQDPNQPDEAPAPIPDRGGNALVSGAQSLHSFWDSTAPDTARQNRPLADYATDLVAAFPLPDAAQPDQIQAKWPTPGDVTLWPQAWADESLNVAKQAYGGITVQNAAGDPTDREHIKWNVAPPAGYVAASSDLARVQLAKAGYHLARLLQVLFP